MREQAKVFLKAVGPLAEKINSRANSLYQKLQDINVSNLPVAAEFRDYFIKHHLGPRLFFSLQNSAHIIFDAVMLCRKKEEEIVFIDYGAGLGTLFMLAGTMDFKQTVYNDYLPEWQQTARSICETLHIQIDDYVTGDIDSVMQHASGTNTRYDIIASRNVIEHIYDLAHFYESIYRHNPETIIFSTTTANFHNPAMRLRHLMIHRKAEKYLVEQRIEQIKKLQPKLSPLQVNKLSGITRGKGQQDFLEAVADFAGNKSVTAVPYLRSNTCDCLTGLWIEHLLTEKEHRMFIVNAGFKANYYCGYWDTHYASAPMNALGRCLNILIGFFGRKRGVVFSPFVNVVAY